MRIDILTLFPEMFAGVLGASILKRAAEPVRDPATGDVRPPVVRYHVTDIREHTENKHGKVDEPPFGGGPGMVIRCQPVWDAVRAVEAQDPTPATRIVMSPQGRRLDQAMVEHFAAKPRLLILAGHYEGFDERVLDALREEGGLEEVSIGDYVLSGGELPAMVLVDAVVRLLPGVLGHEASAHHESFAAGAGGLLDYPVYTRPREWRGRSVPDVLLSGDHAKIEAWRREAARQRTLERRPDLLRQAGDTGDAVTGRGTAPLIVIRDERPADADAIDALHRAAFPTDDEAQLVRDLRRDRDLVISLVAELAPPANTPANPAADAPGDIVGHVAFSPVIPEAAPSRRGFVALGPIAVRPDHQGRGIGAALVREGLARCRQARIQAVFLHGNPAWYTRFGFHPAAPHGYTSPFGSGDEFMIAPLRQPLPPDTPGPVRHAPAFTRLLP